MPPADRGYAVKARSEDIRQAGAPEAGFAHLTLAEFRTYRELSLDLESPLIVVTGGNGAGKTHLLEALSFFAPGGGLLRARIEDVGFRDASNRPAAPGTPAAPIGKSGGIWAVHARYRKGDGEWSLGTGRDPLALSKDGRERRLCRINGAPAKSQAAFAEILSLIWLAPAMDSLLREAASSRRRFLDRLAGTLDPAHGARLADYDFALRERARLLRGEGPAQSPGTIAAWLDSLEAEMAALAVAIAAERRETVAALNAMLAEEEGPFPRAALKVAGAVETWLGDGPALAAEDKLRAALAASRAADQDSGQTQWGTHRSDLEVRYPARRLGGEALAAAEASTGEQKALLLSILLAQARLCRRRRGEMPILLLDEVAAHLDAERRRALFTEIDTLGLSCWMTGSDVETFAPLKTRAQFLTAAAGRVTPTVSGMRN